MNNHIKGVSIGFIHMSDIKELTKLVTDFRDERDWKQFHNPKDLALSLVLEAAEVMEHFQWKNEEESKKHIQEHRKEISGEIADVLYWVLLIAHDFNIDIPKALKDKIELNKVKYPINKSKGSNKKYTEL